MGGSSVPSSTAQFQKVATGIWGSDEASALAKPILKPAMANIKNQQDMLMGFQKGDPEQTRKFFGLPTDAPIEDITSAIAARTRGPQIQMPQVQAATQPTKTAAHGGIMSLDDDMSDPRKFATGGTAAKKKEPTWSDAQNARRDALMQKQQSGAKLTKQETNVLNSLNKNYDTYAKANPSATPEGAAIKGAATAAGYSPADAYLGQAGFFGASYDPVTKQFSVTNPYYNQATNVLQGMNTQPGQFGQATQAYQDTLSGLKGAANYTPQQVEAAQAAAAQASRGDIRDISAQQAQVERMQAAMMQAPTEANVQDYRAAQAKLNQMQGPKSWTDAGVSQQYMSPYMQNVVDIQKREAQRDFGKQMAALNAQAVGAGAYGGSRQAIERSEARRNQAQRLADIEAQGLNEAYKSGMGQFSAEQGLGLQAGQANLSAAQQTSLANQQATNQQRQQYVNNALQAAMQSYGGQLTAAQQNQIAQNAASQFNAGAQNTAYNNYVQQQLAAQQANQAMDWNAVNLNAMNQQQANIQNAQLAQQAAMANQQAGLQANQQNIGAYGQALQGAQGLGALGTQVGNYNAGLANLWGQAGSTLQGLGQGYFNQIQQNAGNVWGGPTTLANQGINTLAGVGGGQSGVTTQTQKTG